MYNLHFGADRNPHIDYISDGVDVAEYYAHEAKVQLGAYRDAMFAYDEADERYQRARARAEAGRSPRYGNPLGIRVQSSGGGHPADDLFATVADLKTTVDEKGTAVVVAEVRVRELIRRACAPGGKYATALTCYYLTYPSMSYADMSAKYPDLFPSKSAAAWAAGRAKGKVADYLRRADEDVANRYLATLSHDDHDAVCRDAMHRARGARSHRGQVPQGLDAGAGDVTVICFQQRGGTAASY